MQVDVLEWLSSLWGKDRYVEKLPLPSQFPKIDDPLSWAIELASMDDGLISTAMRWALEDGPQDDKMIYVSRGVASKNVRSSVLKGFEDGAAIQLQVNDIHNKSREIGEFLAKHIKPILNKSYPFGFNMHASLWATGPEHTYNSHCDLGDHLLLQLCGVKRVKFWGPAKDFDALPLFDFNFRGDPPRFSGPIKNVELNPGEMVFFTKGTMHEVHVPEQDGRSVSLALSVDHLYPLMTLLEEVERISGKKSVVNPTFSSWDKFTAKVFDPNRYREKLGSSHMPEPLKSAVLAALLHPNPEDANALDVWWNEYAKGGKYSPTGTLPRPPSDKNSILKEWETQRLDGN